MERPQPPINLLLVHHEEANRSTISRLLRQAGFEVREASTGAEALNLASIRPHLILLDLNLPDLSALEVYRQFRSDPVTATIPVVSLSASPTEDSFHSLGDSAEAHLTLPVPAEELLGTVHSLLGLGQMEEVTGTTSRQWQELFDSVGEAVCLLDRTGQVLRCTQALGALLGKPLAAIIGHNWQDLLLPAGGVERTAPLTRLLQSGRRGTVELALSGRWLRITANPVFDADGVLLETVCILADLSERKRVEDELRERAETLLADDRRKDEFLAMLAHELRNPLGPVLAALQVLDQPKVAAATAERARRVIVRQVQQMARMVDDLLDVSRISQGKIQLRLEAVELQTIVERAVEMVWHHLDARQHRLLVSLPPEPIMLEADAARLQQVLANLLNNAAKYTDPGGKVTVLVERQGDQVVLTVEDTGRGIDARFLPHVFDLFAQEDRSLDRATGGLGIGLTLVKSIVELHGGSVAARSAGPGQGSTFVVRLPALVPLASLQTTPTVEDVSRSPTARRILVVDDNADSVEMLAELLRLDGHEVFTAVTGPAGLEMVQRQRPEVVLMDIGLPGMDGYEVARRLRQLPEGRDVFLVAVTGYGQEQDRRRGREAGFDRHLVKPLSPGALEELLASLPVTGAEGIGATASPAEGAIRQGGS